MTKKLDEGIARKVHRFYDKASGNQRNRLITKTDIALDNRQNKVLGRPFRMSNYNTDWDALVKDPRYNDLNARYTTLKYPDMKRGRYMTGGKIKTFKEWVEENSVNEGFLKALGSGAVMTGAGAVTGALTGFGAIPGAVVAGLGYLAMHAKDDLNDKPYWEQAKKRTRRDPLRIRSGLKPRPALTESNMDWDTFRTTRDKLEAELNKPAGYIPNDEDENEKIATKNINRANRVRGLKENEDISKNGIPSKELVDELNENLANRIRRIRDKWGGHNSNQALRISSKALDKATSALKKFDIGTGRELDIDMNDPENAKTFDIAKRNLRRAAKARNI